MNLQLQVTEGPDRGSVTAFSNFQITIGRDPTRCDLVLSDPQVSRVHARVNLYEGGIVHLEDLGSSHGTYYNEVKITGPVQISPGILFRLGSSVLGIVPIAQSAPASIGGLATQPAVSISIGREPSNDLILADTKVSRRHARIDYRSGNCYLTDLNSTHGTLLNGQPVSGQVALPPASWLQIQGHKYYFDGTRLITKKGDIAAVFSSLVPLPGGSISFTRALSAPFNGRESAKWLLGSILAVIPIADFLANGYRYQLLKHGQADDFNLPEWKDWGDLFVKGFQFLLVRAFYLTIPIIYSLFIILTIRFSPASVYPLLGWLLFLNLLLYAISGFFIPVALARFASNDSLKDAIQFPAILQVIKANRNQYLTLIFVIAMLWFLVSLLAMIPYIGIIFGIIGFFYMNIVSALLFGEFYARSRATA